MLSNPNPNPLFAVGEVVGYSSVESASRMNGAVVIFLDNPDEVGNRCSNKGHVHPCSPVGGFSQESETLAATLSKYGRNVSPTKMASLGAESISVNIHGLER